MAEVSRLYTTLLNSGLQSKDNALYQVIHSLIDALIAQDKIITSLTALTAGLAGPQGLQGFEGPQGIQGPPGRDGQDGRLIIIKP